MSTWQRKPRVKTQSPNSDGYPSFETNIGKAMTHRALMLAFVGVPPPGAQACHEDGDPSNCTLDNLRWDTRVGNHRDQWRHNTMSHIIHRSERKTIYDRYHAGEAQATIAADYGVESSTITFNIRKHCEETGEVRKDPYPSIIPRSDLPSVFEAYEAGMSLREIGEVYDTSESRVLRNIQSWHKEMYRRPLPKRVVRLSRRVDLDESEVLRRRSSGESVRSIAKVMGCSTSPINRICSRCET